jgi:acyl carrier protein
MKSNKNQIITWLMERLQVNYSEIESTEIRLIPGMNSITFMSLVLKIEELIGRNFTIDEIIQLNNTTFSQLLNDFIND